MKIRVKFEKTGIMKFVGHLDMMRFFQKALRRAEVPMKYSEGFNPHQIMSFAAPLGLGDTSECEYMDIEVLESKTSKEMLERLNRVSVEGVRITGWRRLPDKSKNAMAAMAAADYRLTFREGYEPEDWTTFAEELTSFLSQDSIEILKKTKKSERLVDIKPLIYAYEVQERALFCQVCAGSMNNLKPELLLEAFYAARGEMLSPHAICVHRMELYTDIGEEGKRQLLSLEDVGEELV